MKSTLTQDMMSKEELKKYGLVGLGAAGVGAVIAPRPAAANVQAVSDTVTSLGGIAAAITTVVLGAMGVRMAIKLVNRVAVKG